MLKNQFWKNNFSIWFFDFQTGCQNLGIILEKTSTVKLGFKQLLNKEQIDFKELFTGYQLFYTINLRLNKELLPI